MTSWKPMEAAPKDGRPVLLWARLASVPPGDNDFSQIIGFWDNSIKRWKVEPELLNKAEVLIPIYWTELPPEPPYF